MEILVVDDNRATREMVRFALERRGHRVTEAATAHIATSSVATFETEDGVGTTFLLRLPTDGPDPSSEEFS